jgi:hypothetical protein
MISSLTLIATVLEPPKILPPSLPPCEAFP